jgi:hypothetical protein
MRAISASAGKFDVRGRWFGCCGYVTGDGCCGRVLVIDVEEGESVGAAEIVGVVANADIGVAEIGSCAEMAGGVGGWGLGGALGPKA